MTIYSPRWAKAVLHRTGQFTGWTSATRLRAEAPRVETLEQYVAEVTKIVARWREGDEPPLVWCRGQREIEWDLWPSTFRQPRNSGHWEPALLAEFKRRSVPYLAGHLPVDDWDWLTLMQHHGAPTRLLDWSESALAALHFVVRSIPMEGPRSGVGVVWFLDVAALQCFAGLVPWPFDLAIDDVTTIEEYLITWRCRQAVPFALLPRLNHPRVVGQRGAFTMFGNTPDALERLAWRAHLKRHPFLLPIAIPHLHRERLSDELTLAGVTETTLFPDLEGVARECVMRHRVAIEGW